MEDLKMERRCACVCVCEGGVILNNSSVLSKFFGEARQNEDNMQCLSPPPSVCVCEGAIEKVSDVGGLGLEGI